MAQTEKACPEKDPLAYLSCGLYYNPMTIVNDDSNVVTKLETSLTDNARVVIYDRWGGFSPKRVFTEPGFHRTPLGRVFTERPYKAPVHRTCVR
jgi:hypothetical protein